MKKVLGILLLLAVGCGGPDYPELDTPPQKGIEIPKEQEIRREELPDTLKFMSDVNITYYKEIRPFTLETNDSTIIVDGIKFQIVDSKKSEKEGKTVLSFHVIPYSGLFSGTSLIMIAYNEESVGEVAIPPFGIFSTNRPDKWTLQKEEAKKQESQPTKIHVVGTGQNLSGISRQYGMTISELKELNGLKTSRINVGQKLKVYAN